MTGCDCGGCLDRCLQAAASEARAPLEAENTRLKEDVRDLRLALEQMTTLADEYAADKRALVAENTPLRSAATEAQKAFRRKAADEATAAGATRSEDAQYYAAIRRRVWEEAIALLEKHFAGIPAVTGTTSDTPTFRQPGEPEGLPRSGPQKELKP